MKATCVSKIITMINPHAKGSPSWGRKAAVMSCFMYNWCLKVRRTSDTSLVLLLICVVLVMQEQMPNMTPNATINVVRPFNASKCQFHLMIIMIVIATIIVTCQHVHKTTAPLQLNRLQQEVDRDAVGTEAKMLLTSKMIDSSNNFHFYLRICQKSDCLCNCAHECIRCNMDDHHCECLPVLKKEGVCHVAVGIVSQRIL